MKMNKTVALVLALTLVLGVAVGGTLAWLTDQTTEVKNTFTTSDISITLAEAEDQIYKMIPGWTIAKDPKVTVKADSEDCWLFVKITESTDPDLDKYISYAIADGWQIVEPKDSEGNPVTSIENADEIVIGRKVNKNNADQEFGILGKGSFTEEIQDVACTVAWEANQVGVKPSVTEAMMDALEDEGAKQPTLTFQAYAVQLYMTGATVNGTGTPGANAEFDVDAAWTLAQTSGN